MSELYRRDFESRHIASKGLRFQSESDEPVVHLVRGRHNAAFYNRAPDYDPNNQYTQILAELPATAGVPGKNVMIAFAETYDSGPAAYEWPGGVALGSRFSTAGGFGLFSAWILRPEFCATTFERQKEMMWDKTAIRGRIALGNGRLDSPRFEFIEDGFGAVAHELGHASDCRTTSGKTIGTSWAMAFATSALTSPRNQTRGVVRGFLTITRSILYTSRYLAPAPVLADRIRRPSSSVGQTLRKPATGKSRS